MADSACPGCGLTLPESDGAGHAYLGASPACWSLFSEVLAREYGDPAYWPAHRLTVDAYAAQHPGIAERRTIRSINVHLAGLHLTLECAMGADRIRTVMARLAKGDSARLQWLTPPATLGASTIADVFDATDAAGHIAMVERWASDVWRAWHAHHATIRALAENA